MCVWSAYTGKKQAAPILWDSLKKIEGIWGGFYTGLVVNEGNSLHWEKCVGHTGNWEQQYSLNDFHGTCGLIHSRTNSGGDGRRSHPFVGAEGKVALVSQGCTGIYKADMEKFIAEGNRMLAAGRKCRSAVQDSSRCLLLNDGTKACMSDIVANAVEEVYLKTHDPLFSIQSVCSKLPEESATFFVFYDRPDLIGFVNVNQHVVCDIEADGVMLSVTSIGVPGYAFEIPGNSVGYVTASGEYFRKPLGEAYNILNTNVPGKALSSFREYLKGHPDTLLGDACDGAIRPLMPNECLQYRAAVAYRMLEILYFNGEIKFGRALVQNWSCPDVSGMTYPIRLIEA